MAIAAANGKRPLLPAEYQQSDKPVRSLLQMIGKARKFVLDANMATYFADLVHDGMRGGLRKRRTTTDNMRQLARLPYPLTWFELQLDVFVRRMLDRDATWKKTNKLAHTPRRFGWLFQQHPQIDAAFRATEIMENTGISGRVFLPHPVSLMWMTNDAPLPWHNLIDWRLVPDRIDSNPQIGAVATYGDDDLTNEMIAKFLKIEPELIVPYFTAPQFLALLATINDLPIIIEPVSPQRGYIHRGNYRKFMMHSVVHLTVPETRYRAVIRKSFLALRRRAHQVRGHWRHDWLNGPLRYCDHVWESQVIDGHELAHRICTRCKGRLLWIPPHQRGDASLGFVMHDYDITAKQDE